jgi:hypothetical protein
MIAMLDPSALMAAADTSPKDASDNRTGHLFAGPPEDVETPSAARILTCDMLLAPR